MDFETICMMFSMREPYYGIILSSMNRIPDRTKQTIGVSRSKNVFQLRYNPDFVSKLSVEETMEVLKHEVLHIAFNHFTLFDTPPIGPQEQMLRNIATDCEVNSYLNTKVFKTTRPCLPENFGWRREEGSLYYYEQLKKRQQEEEQQQQAQQPQKPCDGGLGGTPQQQNVSDNSQPPEQQPQQGQQPSVNQQPDSSNQSQGQSQSGNGTGGSGRAKDWLQDALGSSQHIDDHSEWPDTDSEAEKEELQSAIDDMLVFAADETEKGCGKVPGELQGKINLLREKKRPKPVADWKRFFRRYLGNEYSETIRKSKKRESRRFPDAAGNRHRRKSKILVAIDTSGSVSMPEYQEFFGQIHTLRDTTNFHILECDSRIQYEYYYKGKPNATLHGGGGTSFQPCVDYFNEHKKDYEALVYFTDGCAPIPSDTPTDTLWVISSKGKKDRLRYMVNGAKVVFIPPKTA